MFNPIQVQGLRPPQPQGMPQGMPQGGPKMGQGQGPMGGPGKNPDGTPMMAETAELIALGGTPTGSLAGDIVALQTLKQQAGQTGGLQAGQIGGLQAGQTGGLQAPGSTLNLLS